MEGAGIDVDAVAADLRMHHRCVTVHDGASVIRCRLQELVAKPDQIVLQLCLKRNAWPDSGMDEQIVAASIKIFQTLEEENVRSRQRLAKRALHLRGHQLCRLGTG